MARDKFEDAYARTVSEGTGATAASEGVDDYVKRIQEAIDKLETAVVEASDNNQAVAHAQGFVAEEWSTGTHRIDAVVHGEAPTAEALHETVDHGPDIAFGSDRLDPVQVKYYGDPDATAHAVADPGYGSMDRLIPSDQLPEVRDRLLELADFHDGTDPQVAEQYRAAAALVTDHLDHGSAHSVPLTRAGAEGLVADARNDHALNLDELGLTPDQVLDVSAWMDQALTAGAEAAAVSLGLQVAAVVAEAVRRALNEGTLTLNDLAELTAGRAGAVSKSAAAGTIAGALTLAAQSGALGDAAELVAPEAISAVVVLSINAAIASYQAAIGQTTWNEAGYRMTKMGAVLAGGYAGAAIASTIPVPVVAQAVGFFIGATTVRVATIGFERVALEDAIETGNTYWGLIDQDYSIPEAVLIRQGLKTGRVKAPTLKTTELKTPDVKSADLKTPGVKEAPSYLARKAIGPRKVGYG